MGQTWTWARTWVCEQNGDRDTQERHVDMYPQVTREAGREAGVQGGIRQKNI
jgi:hypothetical protein